MSTTSAQPTLLPLVNLTAGGVAIAVPGTRHPLYLLVQLAPSGEGVDLTVHWTPPTTATTYEDAIAQVTIAQESERADSGADSGAEHEEHVELHAWDEGDFPDGEGFHLRLVEAASRPALDPTHPAPCAQHARVLYDRFPGVCAPVPATVSNVRWSMDDTCWVYDLMLDNGQAVDGITELQIEASQK